MPTLSELSDYYSQRMDPGLAQALQWQQAAKVLPQTAMGTYPSVYGYGLNAIHPQVDNKDIAAGSFNQSRPGEINIRANPLERIGQPSSNPNQQIMDYLSVIAHEAQHNKFQNLEKVNPALFKALNEGGSMDYIGKIAMPASQTVAPRNKFFADDKVQFPQRFAALADMARYNDPHLRDMKLGQNMWFNNNEFWANVAAMKGMLPPNVDLLETKTGQALFPTPEAREMYYMAIARMAPATPPDADAQAQHAKALQARMGFHRQ